MFSFFTNAAGNALAGVGVAYALAALLLGWALVVCLIVAIPFVGPYLGWAFIGLSLYLLGRTNRR